MSACMRLPSRIGTITLRSLMAMDSSSFSVALRRAIRAASCVLACEIADGEAQAIVAHRAARQARIRLGFIAVSLFRGADAGTQSCAATINETARAGDGSRTGRTEAKSEL